MLKNALPENIRPASVDLRLSQIFRLKDAKIVDLEHNMMPEEEEVNLPHILKPGEYVLAKTIESIKQPHKKYSCLLSARSRAFRIGLHVETNIFGPYYEGPIVFGIRNISQNPVKLFKGASLVQIAFIELKGDTKPVTHDFQGGKIL